MTGTSASFFRLNSGSITDYRSFFLREDTIINFIIEISLFKCLKTSLQQWSCGTLVSKLPLWPKGWHHSLCNYVWDLESFQKTTKSGEVPDMIRFFPLLIISKLTHLSFLLNPGIKQIYFSGWPHGLAVKSSVLGFGDPGSQFRSIPWTFKNNNKGTLWTTPMPTNLLLNLRVKIITLLEENTGEIVVTLSQAKIS